jgi:integrase
MSHSENVLPLNRWVLPHWGKLELRAIKTVAVEQWLKSLVTSKFGRRKPLAGGTREKMRDAMAMMFLDMLSGLCRGELAGLKWEDFDFKGGEARKSNERPLP